MRIRDKDIKEIRPARGAVKSNSKSQTLDRRPKRTEPTIVQNVANAVNQDEIEPPTEDAVRMLNRINSSKQELMTQMQEFNRLLNIQVLSKNKSIKEKEEEQSVITHLVNAAMSLNEVSNGEGVLGLCILALRQALSLRDAGNELAHKLEILDKKIKRIQKGDTAEDEEREKAKAQLLEQAQKLGISISINEEE